MVKDRKSRKLQTNNGRPTELTPGVKLVGILEGHQGPIMSVAFDSLGRTLASGGEDRSVKLWDVPSGQQLQTLEGHDDTVCAIAFSPQSEILASGGHDKAVKLWDAQSGKLVGSFNGHQSAVLSVAFDQVGMTLASGSSDFTMKLWDVRNRRLLRTYEQRSIISSVAFAFESGVVASGCNDGTVTLWRTRSGDVFKTLEGTSGTKWVGGLAFSPDGSMIAGGGGLSTVKLWDWRRNTLLRTLEGHTAPIDIVAFSPDGRLLASKSNDDSIFLWSCATWDVVAVIPEPKGGAGWTPALAFHPTLPLLATAGGAPESAATNRQIHFWQLDYEVLLSQSAGTVAASRAVHHTTGKIVLVGDHSVGKSALGYRLIHGRFERQESTHGQQFWVFPAMGQLRSDGTECEAILWDFAGQPDYRLVHALFVDNADLALVLFDSSDIRDPMHGVGFWLKQLQTAESHCPIILIAAQTDRGTCSLTPEELNAFCERHGIEGPVPTSAATGLGIDELLERMKMLINWGDKATTVTTTTFKRIKDYVLGLKEKESHGQIIVTPEELRSLLQTTDPDWQFSDPEMLTAVGHLENYGYVKRLRTSKGEVRILLEPERLNNLASSLVLEARRNPKGLGAIEEKRLLGGEYNFSEIRDLNDAERDVLLDSAALLFLEHNICFRETDPLRMEPFLVFPELINLKKPVDEDAATEDGVAYTVSGPTENVFASLVVLLGYTHTFTRTAQWHNNARYEVGEGLVCGFRQEGERDGELDFVLSFGPRVGHPIQTLFQGLFESFLARRNLTVMRYQSVRCAKGHQLNRAVVREAMQHGDTTTFCSKCGEKLTLPAMAEPIQLTREIEAEVESQRRIAEQRTRFEQAVFRVRAFVSEQQIAPPECFISYAWGVPEHERWVEKQLATDLQNAGIIVLLDRWHNAQIGASVARFVERIEESGRVVVVGTPLYRQKAKNVTSDKGSVVAAEYDLAGIRLLATEDQKRTVLPVLLAGDESESFPALFRGRVYGDFRDEDEYFVTAFDLILSLYQLPPHHPAVADLRESLRARWYKV
jgi:small GTP-binding protein